MKEPIMYFCLLLLVLGLGFGGWKLERYVHYKLSYRDMVQEQIDTTVNPLKQRISTLEQQILILQTNK